MTLDQESERFKLVQSLSEGDHGSTLQAVHSPEHQRLIDQLGFMFLTAPHFEDIEFPGQSIDTVFLQLNEGLSRVRKQVGEERFQTLSTLSDRARAHFEADPSDNTGEAREGRRLIREMEEILEPLEED